MMNDMHRDTMRQCHMPHPASCMHARVVGTLFNIIFFLLPVFYHRPRDRRDLVHLYLVRAPHRLLHWHPRLFLPQVFPAPLPRVHGAVAKRVRPPRLLGHPHGRAVHLSNHGHTGHARQDHIHRQSEASTINCYTNIISVLFTT
jgi:hypothetical protein